MIVYTEFRSLEQDLGIPIRTLFALSNNISAHYRSVTLKKKDGGERVLSVPDPILKKVQRAIASTLLTHQPISPYASAYRYGASVQANALPHVGQRMLLKLDIKHFFDSITYSDVKDRCFPAQRFSEPIRILLTMLCYYKDALPQGAPSSPAITNIIMRESDGIIGEYCRAHGIRYTRYCDDMAFSGEKIDVRELTELVRKELLHHGFFLNEKKTVLAVSGMRQSVTGIVVNSRADVPREYKDRIRQEIYYCKKFGVEEHLRRTGSELEPRAYLTSLLGRISFVLHTRPDLEQFKGYREYVKRLLSDLK